MLKLDDYDIVLIESYPCNSKDQLHARERYFTNQMECVNKMKHQGVYNELGQKQYDKQYYLEHLDEIQKNNKQYSKDHADEIRKYKQQYYLEHADEKKQYYLANADKLNAKTNCECGGCFSNSSKSRHLKTIKHQAYLNSK